MVHEEKGPFKKKKKIKETYHRSKILKYVYYYLALLHLKKLEKNRHGGFVDKFNDFCC
jgi:hypothetical protein